MNPVPRKFDSLSLACLGIPVLGMTVLWLFMGELKPGHGDAWCFVPVARNLQDGHGWINTYFYPERVVHAEKPELYNWHGLLAPWIWAKLSLGKGYEAIHRGGTLLSLTGLLALAVLFYRRIKSLLAGWKLLAGVCLAGVAPYLQHNGRPEAVVSVGLVLALLLVPLAPGWSRSWIGGALLSLLALAHPVAAMMTVPLAGMYLLHNHSLTSTYWSESLKVTAGAALLAVILVPCMPFSVSDWILGLRLHSIAAVEGYWTSYRMDFWVKDPERPLLVASCVIMIALPVCWWVVETKGAMAKGLSILMAAVWVVLTLYFAVRVSSRCYNLSAFLPPFAWIFFCMVTAQRSSNNRQVLPGPASLMITALVCLATLPGIAASARQALIFALTKPEWRCRQEAVKMVSEFLERPENKGLTVHLSSNLFEFADRIPNEGAVWVPTKDIYVLEQANRSLIVPPEIPGYHLVLDDLSRYVPRVLGQKIANTPGDFHFAIYRRLQVEDPI